MNNILIYSQQKNNRLSYVIDFINRQFSDLKFNLRIDDALTKDYFQLKVELHSVQEIKIPNKGLALGSDWNAVYSDFEEHLYLIDGALNFDIFSAIFYLLSRAEEYNSNKLDKHGRYRFQGSILYKKKLLEKPVIDYWINDLKSILIKTFGIEVNRSNSYSFQSTLDIDHISAYKHKPLGIFFGGMLRDLLKGRWKKVAARFWKKDPFDTYDEIVNKHRELELDLKVFILCASRSKFDKSLPPENKEFINKVQNLSDKYEIGIHPSYKSESNYEKIDNEIKLLESIVAKDIQSSRFHYLRIQWPLSYNTLLSLGIKADYSMGYPDAVGFRAGTSLPFYWYDLQKEEQTSLKIHPFQIMDVTMRKYQELNSEEAVQKASQIIDTLKEVGGTFCLLWHNSSFFGLEGWTGWRETYDQILRKAKA